MLLVRSQNPNHKQTKKQQQIVIGHSSTKFPGLSVLTVIPPVLSYGNLFLVALLKSKGSWLTRFGYWVPNSAFRNSQRLAFRVNMKSYPGKVWMATAQKWNKCLTHIEHRTGVAEKCPICDDPVSIWTGRDFSSLQKLRWNHQPYPNWFFWISDPWHTLRLPSS